jgi:uncharacterized membrane protein YraQ (UPF0718 family)
VSGKRPAFDWAFALVAALSVGAAAHVLLRDGVAAAQVILIEDIELFLSILPKVAAGCLIGALVRILVPREVIVRFVGEGSGIAGLAIAAGMGAIFPGGPFTVFPLAGAFLLSGADRGAAVAFISGWLLIGLNRMVIWELPFLGNAFVGWRFLLTLPVPVLIGILARSIDPWLARGAGR